MKSVIFRHAIWHTWLNWCWTFPVRSWHIKQRISQVDTRCTWECFDSLNPLARSFYSFYCFDDPFRDSTSEGVFTVAVEALETPFCRSYAAAVFSLLSQPVVQGHKSHFSLFSPRGSPSSEVTVLHLALMRSQLSSPKWKPEFGILLHQVHVLLKKAKK